MRVPLTDGATEGRTKNIIGAFRELMKARMLWGGAAVIILGLVAGSLFYSRDYNVPLQNLPANDQQTLETEVSPHQAGQVAGAAIQETLEEAGSSSTSPNNSAGSSQQSPGGTETAEPVCDENARITATTTRDQRLQKEAQTYQPRGGLDQFVTSLTGGLLGHSNAKEEQRHSAVLAQIEEDYQNALTTAHCL